MFLLVSLFGVMLLVAAFAVGALVGGAIGRAPGAAIGGLLAATLLWYVLASDTRVANAELSAICRDEPRAIKSTRSGVATILIDRMPHDEHNVRTRLTNHFKVVVGAETLESKTIYRSWRRAPPGEKFGPTDRSGMVFLEEIIDGSALPRYEIRVGREALSTETDAGPILAATLDIVDREDGSTLASTRTFRLVRDHSTARELALLWISPQSGSCGLGDRIDFITQVLRP